MHKAFYFCFTLITGGVCLTRTSASPADGMARFKVQCAGGLTKAVFYNDVRDHCSTNKRNGLTPA